jgi:hypothetical protein
MALERRLAFLGELAICVETYVGVGAAPESNCWKCGEWFDEDAVDIDGAALHDGCATALFHSPGGVVTWYRSWLCADCVWYADWATWNFKKAGRRLTSRTSAYENAEKILEGAKQQLRKCELESVQSGRLPFDSYRAMCDDDLLEGSRLGADDVADDVKSWSERVKTAIFKRIKAEVNLKEKRQKCFSVWFSDGAARVQRAVRLLLLLDEVGLPRDVTWGIIGVSCWLV